MRVGFVLAGIVAIALGGCQTMGGIISSGDEPKPAAPVPAAPSAVVASSEQTGSLKGMAGDRLRALWGEPTLKRTEPGAEMWQYGGSSGCTLLVYLYGGTVTHAEALPGGADEAAVSACAKASGKPSLKPIS